MLVRPVRSGSSSLCMAYVHSWRRSRGTDTVSLYVQVLISMPFPDDAVLRGDLPKVITPDVALVLCARLATFDVRHHIDRHWFPPQHHGVAIGQTAKIVMDGVFDMLPEDLAIPVQLHERAASPTKRDRAFARPASHQEAPIVEEIAIGPRTVEQRPVVHNATLHVDEIGARACHRGEQRIAVMSLVGLIHGQAQCWCHSSMPLVIWGGLERDSLWHLHSIFNRIDTES